MGHHHRPRALSFAASSIMLHPLLLAGAVVAQTLPSVSTDATIVSTAIASGNEQIIGVTPYYWGANPTSQETYTVCASRTAAALTVL